MSRRRFAALFVLTSFLTFAADRRHAGAPQRAGQAGAADGRRAGHRRHDRRRGDQQCPGGLHVGPGWRGPADRGGPGGQEARHAEGRADLEHRVAGHERRGLAEARQPRQRAGRPGRRGRRGHHARHGHDRRDGVFPEPGRQVAQARRAHGGDAAGDRAVGRRPAEFLQRRRGGRRQERGRPGRPGGRQRLDSRRRVADQDEHDGRADVHVAARGPDRHGRLRASPSSTAGRSARTRRRRNSRCRA